MDINELSLLEYALDSLNEAESKHLKFELLDPAKLIKYNNLQEVSNPIFFIRDNIPTPDGLLSNEIFGITKDQRANIFAYIDLYEEFMHPLCYVIWNSMDRNLAKIIYGTNKNIINKDGQFIKDEENGNNGLKWLKANIDKIKFKHTQSNKRDAKIRFLEENKKGMFIKQMIVIPPYYRDVNNAGGYVSVGELNKVYNSLILAVRSLKETADYGLNMSNATRGRVQEIIVKIYAWLTGTSHDKDAGKGLSNKYGIIRRSIMSKTTDYGARLVMSAPQLNCESLEDMKANLEYSCLPLAGLCSNLYPFIKFWIRRFFENEFVNQEYPVKNKDGEIVRYKVKDPLIEFSDDRIKAEIERFMKGFSNRFIPIQVPIEDHPEKVVWMRFHGNQVNTAEEVEKLKNGDTSVSPLYSRRLTWCDLIFMACVECSKDKYVMITRYPIDSYYNQFPTKIRVASTVETESMYVNNEFYKYYPKIREEDIGKNTSNKFVDTITISNLFLEGIGGDYDGDQVTTKVAFTREANRELERYANSKAYFINLGASNVRVPIHEAIQSLYCFTVKPEGYKIANPKIVKVKK